METKKKQRLQLLARRGVENAKVNNAMMKVDGVLEQLN